MEAEPQSLGRLEERHRNAIVRSALAGNRAVARLCAQSGATFREIAGGYALFNGVEDPSTQAIELNVNGVSEEQLDELERFFRECGAVIRITISDEKAGKDLIQKLQNRGYARRATLGTWWRRLPALDAPYLPERVVISRVSSEQLQAWALTVATGFREHDSPHLEEDLEPWEVCHFAARASEENSVAFLATRVGDFAGGGLLQLHDGVALLRSGSVRFAHRGKGVQKALISTRLKAASDAGCDIAFSIADRGDVSERNLRKFGFQFLQEGPVMFK
jgi:hypothetical protein